MLLQGRELTVSAGLRASPDPGRADYLSRTTADRLQVGPYGNGLAAFRAGILGGVRGRLERLDPAVAALLQALLLGRREELSAELQRGFRESGSLHLLALSGLHLGILYLVLGLLTPLRLIADRRIRRFAASVLLVGYVLLVGLRPSLERALVMLLAAVLGSLLDREPEPLNLLGLAAAVLLVVHPHYAFDLSFQLSFLSLAAIVLLGPFLHRLWQPYLPAFLGWPLSASLSAQLGTAPVVLYNFGVLYPVGVIAAVPLIPLVALFLCMGMLYLALSFLPLPVADWIGICLGLLHRSIVWLTELFSRIPGLYCSWRRAYWLLLALPLVPPLLRLQAGISARRNQSSATPAGGVAA
jgi:competence protein ComEC